MAHKIREVYIVHHSHTDVGYTDLQEQVIYNQANNIRRAVELIEEGLEKGTNQKDLKWNCETWYCVEQFFKMATEEEKEVPITYLSLETTGVGTAISQELLMGNSEHYGSMVEKLEPGEEKVVTYPYEMCSIWFHKKDWENVEKRSFWLTFSSYPDKIVLYL